MRCHTSVRPNSDRPTYPRRLRASPLAVMVPLYVLPDSGSYSVPFFAWFASADWKWLPMRRPHSGCWRSLGSGFFTSFLAGAAEESCTSVAQRNLPQCSIRTIDLFGVLQLPTTPEEALDPPTSRNKMAKSGMACSSRWFDAASHDTRIGPLVFRCGDVATRIAEPRTEDLPRSNSRPAKLPSDQGPVRQDASSDVY